MSALTHRQRAERAASLLFTDPPPSKPWVDQSGRTIAREMFPRELISLIREVVSECVFCDNGVLVPMWDRPRYRAADGSCERCEHFRLALALYPEPQGEPDHG